MAGGGVLAALKAKPALAVLAGGGALAGGALLLKKRSEGAAPPTYIMTPAGNADTTSADLYNLLQPEIEYLAALIGSRQAQATTPPPASSSPEGVLSTMWDRVAALMSPHWSRVYPKAQAAWPNAAQAFNASTSKNWSAARALMPYLPAGAIQAPGSAPATFPRWGDLSAWPNLTSSLIGLATPTPAAQ